MRTPIILILFSFAACSGPKQSAAPAPQSQMPANISLNGKIFTAMWQQRAAEYRALCYQAYNIAKLRIDNFVSPSAKPRAIVTDIDETILDNSPYAVHQGLRGVEYESIPWKQWTDMAAADTMPGAADFLKYAAAKNITIFYISNRDVKETAGTVSNLKKFGLPNADEAHVLLRTSTGSKEPRRQLVLQSHEIVFLMGDNLADFNSAWDIRTEPSRRAMADNFSAEFGKRFIVFPNPNYGDWEGAFYDGKGRTQAGRDSVMRARLKSY